MHEDEQRKETLTKEDIKKDILPLLLREIAGIVIAYILLLIIGLLTDWLFVTLHIPFRITFILFVILTVITIPILLYIFIQIYKTCKFKFVIDQDFLVDKKDRVEIDIMDILEIIGILGEYRRPYMLQFARCGKFAIWLRWNYKWSSLYTMNDEELFHSSQLKDDFLLISLNGKHIDMAYNLRLFDFKE